MPDAESTTTEAPEESRADALSPEGAELIERLRAALGDAVLESAGCFGDPVVRVRTDAWQQAAQVCRDQLGLEYLSFVAGIDWMPAPAAEEGSGDTSSPAQPSEQTYGVAGSAGRFQVLAHVEATRAGRRVLTLKADVDEATMRVPSWVPVYSGADWHERETWEMYGIDFEGHPSMRHLYLPSEFEGHPLRKDYPLLAREVKPWPGLVDVEAMPGDDSEESGEGSEG